MTHSSSECSLALRRAQEEEDVFCEAFKALDFGRLDKKSWSILLGKIHTDRPGILHTERTPTNLKDKARTLGLLSPT